MQLRISEFEVHKRVAVAISRGTYSHARSFLVELSAYDHTGLGEASDYDTVKRGQTAADIARDLERLPAVMEGVAVDEWAVIERRMLDANLGSATRAAVDLAWLDWWGRLHGQPVWKLLGLPRPQPQVTSVTIGINTPAGAQERIRLWRELGPIRSWKIKLGAPAGIATDKEMFAACRAVINAGESISVDANAGWSLADAITMSHWLGERGVISLEQPLAVGAEEQLPELIRLTSLPIYLDESCGGSSDVIRLQDCCHGINIKLLKAGGFHEGLRMAIAAKAAGLKVMLGCYSQTSLGNGAAAHLAGLADVLDLDSHLNLKDDPFRGLELRDGQLILAEGSGWGVTRAEPA